MAELHLNRDRRKILAAAARGRVTLGETGIGIYLRGSGEAGLSGRCDGAVRQMEAAGWLRLGDDGGTYEPTETGRALLDGGDR